MCKHLRTHAVCPAEGRLATGSGRAAAARLAPLARSHKQEASEQLSYDKVTGADAAKIGLVMKAVPPDALEDEVEGLADRFALVDPDLLAANKRITNLALELMGAQTLQRLAGENDARAHRAPAVRQYVRDVREHGLKETLRRRDEPFGEGYVRVDAPEGRSDSTRKR